MALERLACRGLAERLTSGLRFQWEDEAGHRKSWRRGVGGVPDPGTSRCQGLEAGGAERPESGPGGLRERE